jgi:subtilisin family serine protease
MFRKYILVSDELPVAAAQLSTFTVGLANLGMHILYVVPALEPTLRRLTMGLILEEAKEVRAIAGSDHRDRINQRLLPLDGILQDNRKGQGVPIYILDTGVSPHVEFGSRLKRGHNVTSNGLFLGLVPLPIFGRPGDPNDTTDRQGHGTHVASLAAGETAGTSHGNIIPVKVLGDNGSGSTDWILSGIDWILGQPKNEIAVVNASLGGSASPSLDEGFRRLVQAGFRVSVAAGNENQDVSRVSPARVEEVITVGAVDDQDNKASFSNFSTNGLGIDIWAPGVNINAAWNDGKYRELSGTSMASPIVAGILASSSPKELLESATPFSLGKLAFDQ